jgi:hypothetical protein
MDLGFRTVCVAEVYRTGLYIKEIGGLQTV